MLFRRKVPIVFIHGIMGSMGEGVLKGKGELKFGISEEIYRPIIDMLESFGYKEGRDLFISYYDWTKRNMDSAKNYLIPTIEKAKQRSKSQKVDIIAHSMGGIVARSYAQSEIYKNDINKLIMIGTPNAGSANAYFFWSGGDLISRNPYKNVLYTLIRSVFVWYVRYKYDKDIDIDFIRDKVPSVEELLPAYDYGNYLISENKNQEIDIETMSIKNETLNSLNCNRKILKERGIKTYLIVGKGIETIDKIKIISQDDKKEIWKDGKPSGSVTTEMGDGTVTCNSIEELYGEVVYIDSDHTEILSKCKDELASILNIRRNMFIKQEKNFDIIYMIIGKDVEIRVAEGEPGMLRSCSVITQKMSDDIGWVMVKTRYEDKIDIKIKSEQNQGEVVINKVNLSTGSVEERIMKISSQVSIEI